ncbi:MAG TPA: hypothetical protein PLB62_03800 [Candidatus Sumerlaeota bacterium]|nr:hypothetical protein [Candidatus Sumerlaeota bacterium]
MKKILLLTLAALLLASAPYATITIGQGPAVGTTVAGFTYYEEFLDWTHDDLRALDPGGSLWDNRYNFSDGYDDSRDMIAFYSRDEGDHYYFRIDFWDLKLGAENGFLDFYIAIDCAPGGQTWFPDFTDLQADPNYPWDLCLCIYSSGTTGGTNFNIYNAAWSNTLNTHYLGSYFHSELDAVELGIHKNALTAAGWDGSRTLYFQVFTTKDGTGDGGAGNIPGHGDATDAFLDQARGYDDGFLNGAIASNARPGRAVYASIAHGNQSVNRSDDIRKHIYDPDTTNKTGFIRALETHEMFRVPLNVHMSGSLIIAAAWAAAPTGASDPSDGPAFLQRVKHLLDPAKNSAPSSLVGGVLSEHIMPYFEGDANRVSIELFDEISDHYFGLRAGDMRVMHTPERVIRSQPTDLSPLTGLTFADIEASPYTATVLDEVTHYHWWFDAAETRWSGVGGSYDAPAHHKIHKINGVYCFLINDREDQEKFNTHDGGLSMDCRYTLLEKAMQSDQAQMTLVFDDWEALAGKSFDSGTGTSKENDNQKRYNNTIRWIANHPWVEVVNLKDVVDRAVNPANPRYNAAWVINQGTGLENLSIQTYEWLKHATENSYNYWYYNNDAGHAGNEQDFYNLVPVILGKQGDYRARGETPANDGPSLPGGKKLGDLNTPGTLLHDAWNDIFSAPDNEMRALGLFSYCCMIYETAWHEEDNNDYHSRNYQNWTNPDASWDGMNTWALRLNNHARNVGIQAEAARWAEAALKGTLPAGATAAARDLDFDGEDEYVLQDRRVFACFEKYGGRCVFAAYLDAANKCPVAVIGAPAANPSAPGEEEYTGPQANRCSAFKDMNDGTFADAPYNVMVGPDSLTFYAGSPNGTISRTISLLPNVAGMHVAYSETLPGDLYIRIGVSPDNMDLMMNGRSRLSVEQTAAHYAVRNQSGAMVKITTPSGVQRSPSPAYAGYQNRNLALTEEIEIYGNGAFTFDVIFDETPPTPTPTATPTPSPSPTKTPTATATATPIPIPTLTPTPTVTPTVTPTPTATPAARPSE